MEPCRFLIAGDCCSGIPHGPHEATFAAIVSHMTKLAADRAFIGFLGDHIMGRTKDHEPTVEELKSQWRYWLDHEFAFARAMNIPVYHLTSNHNTFSAESERVFREIFPDIPQNGPADDIGLSYFAKPRDDLLLIFTNSASSRLGHGHVETEWLGEVLEQHRSIPNKLVFGHYPILPVNGYTAYPQWRIEPRSGDAMWQLLKDHNVRAYVCSHVIAFDVRAKDGVLQLCSGGAGTRYGPTGDFMRGPAQYFHFVDCVLDESSVRFTAIDEQGAPRSSLRWPLGDVDTQSERASTLRLSAEAQSFELRDVAALRFAISTKRTTERTVSLARETLVCGFDLDEGPPTVWIGLEGDRLVCELVLRPGGPVGRWVAERRIEGGAFLLEIHPLMGPGGVMLAFDDNRRSSLFSRVAETLTDIRWPLTWRLGQGASGPADEPFYGELDVTMLVAVR